MRNESSSSGVRSGPADWMYRIRAVDELSIVLPCLDEAETLTVCIDKARDFMNRHGVSGEVIVADNGSTDGSQEIARAHGARVVVSRQFLE